MFFWFLGFSLSMSHLHISTFLALSKIDGLVRDESKCHISTFPHFLSGTVIQYSNEKSLPQLNSVEFPYLVSEIEDQRLKTYSERQGLENKSGHPSVLVSLKET